MLGFTLTQPATGKLIARYGAKRIMLGSAALFGVALVGLSMLVVGRWSFYTCTFLWGAVAGGTSPLPHGTIIARWFTLRRGLAMGIVAAGVAAGVVVLPLLVSYVITAYGWRTGKTGASSHGGDLGESKPRQCLSIHREAANIQEGRFSAPL